MDLYFSPMACSLASRIALYEAGAADVRFIEVDPKSKRTLEGADYREIYPLGLVPLLRLDDGTLLSENAAILQYIASRYPDAKLAPTDDLGRARLQQWLCFIGTELHKALFIPLFDQKCAGRDAHAHAQSLRIAPELPQRAPHRPRIFARSFQHRRRVSLYRPQLDDADRRRTQAVAGDQMLPRNAANAAEHRQSLPRGDGSLQGRTCPPQSGGVRFAGTALCPYEGRA